MENKHTKTLREIAKFLTGLIVADMIVGWWFESAGIYRAIPFLGKPITPLEINLWIIFDILLVIFLVHFAWQAKIPFSQSKKLLFIISGAIFSAVSMLHLFRIVFDIPIVIGSAVIPIWLSIFGTIIAGFLAYASFHFASK